MRRPLDHTVIIGDVAMGKSSIEKKTKRKGRSSNLQVAA